MKPQRPRQPTILQAHIMRDQHRSLMDLALSASKRELRSWIRGIRTCVLYASLFLASVASPPARAEDWHFIFMVNGRTISLDMDSIGREGALMRAWLRFEFPDDEPEWFLRFTHRSAKVLEYFDCPTRSSTVVRNISYSGPGLSGLVVDDSGISTSFFFLPFTKGTYAEAAGNLVCSGIPTYQPSATG